MSWSRRHLLYSLAAAGVSGALPSFARAQGVIDRHVKAQPRGPKSGLPFHASLIDVAQQSGRHAPTVYGPLDHKDYILEAVGCGCAFLDYDNDGWMDILMLSGTVRGTAPAQATNRLYRNNRDGTFTDVTAAAGLDENRWASAVWVVA